MKYTIKAEKIEVAFEVDGSFVEALLGAVRTSKKPYGHRVYTPYPEDNDDDFDPEGAVKSAPKSASQPDSDLPKPDGSPAPEIDRTTAIYSKWYTFVLMWLVNFDQEGTQPNRGENTRELAHSRKAGKVVNLVQELGGTTHAVYDVVETAFQNNESARLDGLTDDEREKLSRFVAENITQVSSILFADLSDLLEYHNPLEEEED